MQYVVYFSLHLVLGTFYVPIHIEQVTLEIRAEMHIYLRVKCQLPITDFKQNII
jgi:hypothetical protein